MTADELNGAAADLLREAADMIERVGWTQRAYASYKNGQCIGYCVVGALSAASKDSTGPGALRVVSMAKTLLGDLVGPYISYWNDSPDQTKENVLSTLREVARRASEPDAPPAGAT